MAVLTREQVKAAARRPGVPVPCPEWGGDVLVRSMSGAVLNRYMVRCTTREGESDDAREQRLADLYAWLVAQCCVDAAGARLFNLHDVDDLQQMDGAPILRLVSRIRELTGLGEKVEERTEKNSVPTPGGGSSSDSAGNGVGVLAGYSNGSPAAT